MAVTSIWPINGRVDQVIDYARNPEKTTKAVSERQAQLHTIDGVVEYAADDMKTEERCYVTGINCREDIAAKQFMETKDFWTRITGKDKFAGRVCFHGYQSFAAGEVDAETAHEIGVKLASKLWGDRYEVIVATHCNTGHYTDFVFLNPDGRPHNPKSLNKALNRIVRDCNYKILDNYHGEGTPEILPHIHAHLLRHSFTTRMVESGIGPAALKELLGHADITTTYNIYTHLTDEAKANDVSVYEAYIEKAME